MSEEKPDYLHVAGVDVPVVVDPYSKPGTVKVVPYSAGLEPETLEDARLTILNRHQNGGIKDTWYMGSSTDMEFALAQLRDLRDRLGASRCIILREGKRRAISFFREDLNDRFNGKVTSD